MSFIFQDKKFLNFIYKMAQEGASEGIAPLSEDLVNKIFDNIKQQKEASRFESISSGKKVGDRASATEAAYDQPSVKDLSNLDVFLDFCKRAEVRVSNNNIVIDYDAFYLGDNKQDLISYRAKSIGKTFFVNTKGLSLYLEFLKSSEDYKTNRVYIYMLGELIRDAKSAFGIDVSTLEDTVIANLSKEIDIAKVLAQNNGNVQLKLGDLRDFPAWYKKNGISVISVAKQIQPEKDAQCALLKYLHDKLSDDNHKNSIKVCADNLGCATSGWGAGSLTQQPAQTSQSMAAGAITDANKTSAGQNLIRILRTNGPFKRNEVYIGDSIGEKETDSLISFCNNAEDYFKSLSDSYRSNQPVQLHYDQMSTMVKDACYKIFEIRKATGLGRIHTIDNIIASNIGKDIFKHQISLGLSGMSILFNCISEICIINNMADSISEQKYNYEESITIINIVRNNNLKNFK